MGAGSALGSEQGLTSVATGLLHDLDVAGAHLVGHSLGGTVAVDAALASTGRIASVAVLGGIVSGAPPSPAFVAWAEHVVGLAKEGLQALVSGLPDTVMYQNCAGLRIAIALHDAAFVEEILASAYAAAAAARTPWDRLRAGELPVPALFLNGVDDPASPLRATELAAQVPSATGVDLPGAGHLTIIERPEAVVAHLADFMICTARKQV